jgi:hypothetical protein
MQLGDLGPKPIASQDPYIQSQTSFCSPIRQQYKPPAVWKAGAQKKLFTEHMGSTRSLRSSKKRLLPNLSGSQTQPEGLDKNRVGGTKWYVQQRKLQALSK